MEFLLSSTGVISSAILAQTRNVEAERSTLRRKKIDSIRCIILEHQNRDIPLFCVLKKNR
jgi:ribosomal protein L39E